MTANFKSTPFSRTFRLGLLCSLVLLLSSITLFAQDTLKSVSAVRFAKAPVIDGLMEETEWNKATYTDTFIQSRPIEGAQASQRTKVRMGYTDDAIYVFAELLDKSPDSILHQLGKRDEMDMNADYFCFKIDPYANHQDAFQFTVYASGVQLDNKYNDYTFNAVWNSAVKLTDMGWTVEMEIPFSAIRFPSTQVQDWNTQMLRYIRRERELIQWSFTPSGVTNPLEYWGKLTGIENIKTPVRLALIPYGVLNYSRSPQFDEFDNYSYSNSYGWSAGADIKYGIDDRFTLDMTLLPDFGQVQSDNKIKNLSYTEVVFDENRPFFQEGVDLFTKGDLFYSRRIGKTPGGFFSVSSELNEGDVLVENPTQSKLLNATKVSGRLNNGLGIGFFNATTDNTYALIKNSNGDTRKVLTESFANYNILVIDKQYKSNNNFYIINLNTTRRNENKDANVTGAGFSLFTNNKKYVFVGDGVYSSQQFHSDEQKDLNGYRYNLKFAKVSGAFKFGMLSEVIDTAYNVMDLGYFTVPGIVSNTAYVRYNLFQPWKFLRDGFVNLEYTNKSDFKTGMQGNNSLDLNGFVSFLDFNAMFFGGGFTPSRNYDMYEPRTPGYYFHGYRYFYGYAGFSTDYRKKFAYDISLNISNFLDEYRSEGYNPSLSLRFRPNDHWFITTSFSYNLDPANIGYAPTEDTAIVFGLRRLDTYTNEINCSYTINDRMNISLRARNYCITGIYKKYFYLLENGELADYDEYQGNSNFKLDLLNIDLIYEYRFAPGSVLNIVYKNSIDDAASVNISRDYGYNTKKMFLHPRTDIVSIKLLYYLDYQDLKKGIKRSSK
jgi:hypothetical protein